MNRMLCVAATALLVSSLSHGAAAQPFEGPGVRAAGMAGTFVGVADDASAVYWNPGGLAAGAYFSLLLDRNVSEAKPDDDPRRGSRSAVLFALSTPAVGVSYYRLRTTVVQTDDAVPAAGATLPATSRLQTLITHNVGSTVVHSVARGVAIGTTVRIVRGIAAVGTGTADTDPDDLLEEAGNLSGRASNKVDADIGLMAGAGTLRLGVTVRNLRAPEFETADGLERVRLNRQARAGVSIAGPRLLLALDADLTRNPGTMGEVRNVAVGAEARVVSRALIRAGARFNTLTREPDGHAAVVAIGGSIAVRTSFYVDAQMTTGSAFGDRGWGVAGRVGF